MIEHAFLLETLQQWGLDLSAEQLGRLAAYVELLVDWNQRLNLVARSTLPDLTSRHLLDSLALASAWESTKPPVCLADIGSGAGLPGIPLAILWPATAVTLVEAVGKKSAFLQAVAASLPLPNVTVLTARAEEVGQQRQQREHYDLVTGRAVAHLATLAEYCLPLCRVGGLWLAPKGHAIDQELAEAQPAFAQLGGQLRATFDVQVPGAPVRSLVVIEKIRATPAVYPRSVGLPAKYPL